MGRHFIHYNRRQVRLIASKGEDEPWFGEIQSDQAGFQRPEYHVTRATTGAAAEVSVGDTIWLIGQVYSPWGKLPPAIDARIDVAGKTEVRDGGDHARGYRFEAAVTSRWFPLADASEVFDDVETQDRNGELSPLRTSRHQPIGQLLQRMRRLSSGDKFLTWESKLNERGLEFVSYRLCDGTPAAFTKVKCIVEAGRSVFWDRWSLPRRLAERREQLSDPALESYIHEQLRRATIVWGIASLLYGENESYSAREMTLAKNLGTFRLCNPRIAPAC